LRIWIWIEAGKSDPQKREEISCFEVLDVFFGGLEASSGSWKSFKEV
jgi:hypothetical protein